MMIHRQKLEHKQQVMFRLVNIGTDLFAMSASLSRTASLIAAGGAESGSVAELCDLFCRDARHRIEGEFKALFHNDDSKAYDIGRRILEGRYEWLETGILAGC
jgi:hypothetical protein